MILILSTTVEQSTIKVIQWLNHLNIKWFRLNKLLEQDLNYNITIDNNLSETSFILSNSEQEIDLNKISSVWYRRREKPKSIPLPSLFSIDARHKINTNILTEEQALYNGLCHKLDKKKWLNSPKNSSLNKIFQLVTAQQLGIKIPATKLTSNKNELLEFSKKYPDIIIKNIRDLRPITHNDFYYVPYVKKISKAFLNNLEDHFYPTLAQEYIEKEFEIRTFYLKGKCFSMAMFTQKDTKTNQDFRRYNHKNPTRYVPFQLPDDIENKIKKFMHKVELNCGSLDIIYSYKKEFIFLEVNPVGQFGMVSYPCNYNLHKEIALSL